LHLGGFFHGRFVFELKKTGGTALKFRLFRRRLTISSPCMAVRSALPCDHQRTREGDRSTPQNGWNASRKTLLKAMCLTRRLKCTKAPSSLGNCASWRTGSWKKKTHLEAGSQQ